MIKSVKLMTNLVMQVLMGVQVVLVVVTHSVAVAVLDAMTSPLDCGIPTNGQSTTDWETTMSSPY